MNGFNVVYQQFIALFDSGQICSNWSRLKPGFDVRVHSSTMPKINMILGTSSSHFKLTLRQPALL